MNDWGELIWEATVANFATVQMEGDRQVMDLSLCCPWTYCRRSISHDQAMKKAKDEYRKYQEITLSPVEEEYLKSIKGIEREVKKRKRKGMA